MLATTIAVAACTAGGEGPQPASIDAGGEGNTSFVQADAATDVATEALDVAAEAPDAGACAAAGGACVPVSIGSCSAIALEDCGPGEACCLPACGPDAQVIRASNYDQTCTDDKDCADISEGTTCNVCNFSCSNAAINVNALSQYNVDTPNLILNAEMLCPSSCGGPQPTCCSGGTCHRGNPCPFSDLFLDSGKGAGDASAGPGDADAE